MIWERYLIHKARGELRSLHFGGTASGVSRSPAATSNQAGRAVVAVRWGGTLAAMRGRIHLVNGTFAV
jgi:hypothetical protein